MSNETIIAALEAENEQLRQTLYQRDAFIRSTFGRYLTDEVLEEILKDKDFKIGGERRDVAMLFADLRGSTQLSEQMDPVDFIRMLNHFLEEMIEMLNPGGRLCIITFHSLEDRIVKSAFRTAENPCICPPEFPVCTCGRVSKGRVVNRKPITASEDELTENPRSSSAKLRIFEKK